MLGSARRHTRSSTRRSHRWRLASAALGVLAAALLAAPLLLVGGTATVAADTFWHVPVLMYHNVLPPSEVSPTERLPGLFVDPTMLDEQMAALKANGWHTISLRQLAAAMSSGAPLPEKSIVISFDDGRPNNYTTAAPIVEKYGFRATFFVVPGRIGTDREMTAAQISDLAARGHEIANHTLDHVDLTSVTFDQARAQIRLAGDVIQSLTGLRPVALAYPYGPTDATAEEAAAAEGIQLAFVTDHGYGETWARRLDLHRTRVAGMIRLPNGSVGGGETADELLRSIAADAGRTDFTGPTPTPWPAVTGPPGHSTPQPRDAATPEAAAGLLNRGQPASPSGSAGSALPLAPPLALLVGLSFAALAVAALLLVRRRWRPTGR
jgi:peptidoglycan/xylan/chitin deacetylase (PgdA/CDA1 family)